VRITVEKLGKRFGEFACTKQIGRRIHKPRGKTQKNLNVKKSKK
jgi:hypothetical protein